VTNTSDIPGDNAPPAVELRSPDCVMRLSRMGASFPSRLSFMRSMLRHLTRTRASVDCTLWEMNDEGYGRAVYQTKFDGHTYSLVAFSTELAPENRTDRVIAEAWDTSYVLFDGIPEAQDLERLAQNAPRQEAGRFDERDLVLSRANKSVRLFEHVADSLANGRQPDVGLIRSIGYLMRTTAVYGNGKFGIADRDVIAGRPGLGGPFRAEMLQVWLIRGFTHDLVEHIARSRDPEKFVPLARPLKRYLGIGNATGLGMAPFLVNHPLLLNNWVIAKETALARVRAQPAATAATAAHAGRLFERVKQHLVQWNVDDHEHMQRIVVLRREFRELSDNLDAAWWSEPFPWERLIAASEPYSLECQELVVSLALEPHGELIDDLEAEMSSEAHPVLLPAMRIAELRKWLHSSFAFALQTDFSNRQESAQFWYVSEEKLEPRLGSRYQEEGAQLEQPLDIARRVQALSKDLASASENETVAEFLMRLPVHRLAVLRVQTIAQNPYSEIRDNLISEQCLPIDMLRFKLAFFGASKFDPRSDRWTRIALYQGAPLFDELAAADADDWWLPVLEVAD
jgi:hypothetical protein